MLRKTITFGSLFALICSTSSLAHGHNFRSGFLAGAHVGYSFGTGKFSSTFTLGVVAPAFTNPSSTESGSANKSGPLFGILGGYRHIFNQNYTIGANLEANIFGSNEFNKQLNHSFNAVAGGVAVRPFINRLKKTFDVIPSIAVGKIFCDHYHVSLGLGLAIARFKQQIERPSILTSRSTQTKVGVVPSLGVEYAATKNVSITGNLSYEIYSKISKTYDTNAASGGSTYTSSIKPRYATLKIGAIYRF